MEGLKTKKMSNLNPVFDDICKNHGLSSQNPMQEAWDKSVNNMAYNKAIDDCLKEFNRVWEMLPKQLNHVAKDYEKTLLKMKK